MPTQVFSDAADSFTVRLDGDYSLTFLAGNDTLTVYGGTTVIADMGDGDDYVRLLTGMATVYGGSGADRFDIRTSGAIVHGGDDDDLFTDRGGAGQTITGDSGDDHVIFTGAVTHLASDGGAGDDTYSFYARAVTGTILGGEGDDRFLDFNGSGGLTLSGGPGNDTYCARAGNFATIVERPGEGTDLVQLARGVDYVMPDNVENLRVASYAGSTAAAATLSGNSCDNQMIGWGNSETISGLDGNDHLYGKGGDDILWGDAGNDALDGGDGNDMLYGQTGNDVLNGRAGDDRMVGGSGDDHYYVDSAGDVVTEYPDGGTDTVRTTIDLVLPDNVENGVIEGSAGLTLYGNVVDNHLTGGAGDDTIFADGGNDIVRGGAGNDYLGGEAGNDTLVGGAGNDCLFGDEGNDILFGGDGDDYVQGYTGVDRLDGGSGNDFLAGGPGADTLTGGSGADTFFFYESGDSTRSAPDCITDFVTAAHGGDADQLDLSGIDANLAVAGDQAFAGLSSGPAAHSLWTSAVTTNADGSVDFTLYGDVNGDHTADFAIVLHATAGFSAADIVM